MRRTFNILFFLFFLLMIPVMSFAGTYTFSDNFNDPGIDGWTGKIGTWVNFNDSLKSSSTTAVYSTIWNDGSNIGGLYQSITVDANFDFTNNPSTDDYAQLRLRTGEHSGATQPFWDTGYLATFSETGLSIHNVYMTNNPEIGSFIFDTSLSSGWHTLRFDVSGRGSDTNFKLWVEHILYLDIGYDDTTGANDNGYIGLGRLIEYDNARGYSSDTSPVPEPATIVLLVFGLLGIAGVNKKRITK